MSRGASSEGLVADLPSSSPSSLTMRPPSIGVLREAYSKWERRAPLTPAHVGRATANGLRVLVQPCTKRVFSDAEYAAAGAQIVEDLSPATAILGVKQPMLGSLLPERTHMFFSHTIKGQPENMPLLDEALAKRVRMIDYECVRENGSESGPRLIAFGEFAGKAGLISGLRGLGLRLLALGHSSALLGIGPPHSYLTYSDARRALGIAGRQIAEHGLPTRYAPMVIGVIGQGNVARGAIDAIEALDGEGIESSWATSSAKGGDRVVEWVGVEDLAALSVLAGTPGPHQHKVYCVRLGVSDIVARSDGGRFDKAEYYSQPELYAPVFHRLIAPHVSMLVTTMYWDRRFPRLLTSEQLRELGSDDERRLLAVADLTCDVNGAVEALTRISTIDDPFYMYDTRSGHEGVRGVDGPGIVMLGVDILPAELPREASAHFGDCLLPFLGPLASYNPCANTMTSRATLPPELEAATITAGGRLRPSFKYIDGMRRLAKRKDPSARALALQGSTVLSLRGHLFDSGFINSALDAVEKAGGRFDMLDVQVRPNSTRVPAHDGLNLSSALLQVTLDGGRPALERLIDELRTLAEITPSSHALVTEMPIDYCGGVYERTLHEDHLTSSGPTPAHLNLSGTAVADMPTHGGPSEATRGSAARVRSPRRVLVLGAGLVAAPALEFLSRDASNIVEVVSGKPGEAMAIAQALGRPNVHVTTLDVSPTSGRDWREANASIERADAVLSLLPAPMHVAVARACISYSVPLITASYVSDELASLDAAATQFGVPILCEMGLDPGIDHMSARSIIDAAKREGGIITSFTSVCGGLPAPEVAADNPFGYKFSWSPQGVLAATDNGARFLSDGRIVHIEPGRLLQAAAPLSASPLGRVMRLEVIPNRDSLAYRDLYGLDSSYLRTLFRGTLRYEGFSSLFGVLMTLGLTDGTRSLPDGVQQWPNLLAHLGIEVPASGADDDERTPIPDRAHEKLESDVAARVALEWLGALDPSTSVEVPPQGGWSVRDATCALLERRLKYRPTERDAVLMEHQICVEYPEGRSPGQQPCKHVLTSTLVEYGTPGGASAMSRTVGLAAAAGVSYVLSPREKIIDDCEKALPTGILRPTLPSIYEFALPLLAREGLYFNENVRVYNTRR